MASKTFGNIKNSEGHTIWGVLGGSWKIRQIDKKNRAARESGRKKGISPSGLLRTFCKRNRSYKNPLYGQVMAQAGVRGKRKGP